MPSSILGAGAGASEGLEQLLARLREEEMMDLRKQQFAETKRSNLADEGIRRQTAGDAVAQRIDAQNSLAQSRTDQALSRQSDDERSVLAMTKRGTVFTPEEKSRALKLHAAPESAFSWQPPKVGSSFQGDATTPAGELGPTPEQIKWEGTSGQADSERRLAESERRNLELEKDRDASRGIAQSNQGISQHRENRLTDWGPPPVAVADPNVPGGSLLVPRGNIPASGVAAPAPAGLRTTAVNNEVGLDQLDRLQKMFDEGGKDVIGPAAGRMGSLRQQVPGVGTDPKFNDFAAATSTFRNAVIKAITGAQMSEVEATRIREQIPDITDKPEVWTSKAQMTRQNLQDLMNRLGSVRGKPSTPAAPTGGGDAYDEYLRRHQAKP